MTRYFYEAWDNEVAVYDKRDTNEPLARVADPILAQTIVDMLNNREAAHADQEKSKGGY